MIIEEETAKLQFERVHQQLSKRRRGLAIRGKNL